MLLNECMSQRWKLWPQVSRNKRSWHKCFFYGGKRVLRTTIAALQFANSKPKPPQPLKPAHDLTVTLEPDSFTEEKYVIFENYQRMIHKEPPSKISKYGFKNFLCSSPIRRSTFTWENGQRVERKLGSYHQCYRLDGKLIAVGVLDLLPQCVSAVYFMYHQDAIQWNFGKLGALRETSLALEFDYRYYYMGKLHKKRLLPFHPKRSNGYLDLLSKANKQGWTGFYIHSCIKMRYKGDYHPQYVLDPRTHTWDLFDDDLRRKMDAKKFVCLSEERERPMINGNPDGNSEAGDNHANGVKDLSVDSSAMDEGEDKDDEMETVSRSVNILPPPFSPQLLESFYHSLDSSIFLIQVVPHIRPRYSSSQPGHKNHFIRSSMWIKRI